MPNPEGINQYTHGGGGRPEAAERLKASTAKLRASLSAASASLNNRTPAEQARHEDAKRASAAAHGATRGMAISGSTNADAHRNAADLHERAAAANRIAGNHEAANYHQTNAEAHLQGAHASRLDTGSQHNRAAQAFEHAEQSRLSAYHADAAQALGRRGKW